jgi:S-adenosyl methyltransferase
MADEPSLKPHIDEDSPHAARVWNYWMGGKDNYAADRAAGDAVSRVYPDIVTMARQSRRFLIRAVSFLARGGTRQFLDIGTGLPTMQNTHEVAQRIAPTARIAYVDNDPMVLAHARALLANTTAEGMTTYIDADFHEPDAIVTAAGDALDLTRPVGVMFMGVLGYVDDFDEVRSIVSRVMAAVPPGSYLTLWDGTSTGDAVSEGASKYAESGAIPYHLRSPDQLKLCFDGLELVDPGLVPITRWRADTPAEHIDAYGAIGRKP